LTLPEKLPYYRFQDMLGNVITIRIREVAQKRGITTAYQLQKLTGAQPSQAARWYRNELKMISFDTLDLLCRKLDCAPSDLIAYKKK
jgi:DNA-binding Xre family transcriptional regulator